MLRLNLEYWLWRLAGRATCVLNDGASLKRSSRILNARKDSRLIRIGKNAVIAGESFVFAHGGDISIGEWCFIGEGARIWSSLFVRIGDRVLIAHNANIFDSLTHPLAASL